MHFSPPLLLYFFPANAMDPHGSYSFGTDPFHLLSAPLIPPLSSSRSEQKSIQPRLFSPILYTPTTLAAAWDSLAAMAMTMAMAGVSTYVPTGLVAKPLRTPKNSSTSKSTLSSAFNLSHCKSRTVCSASEGAQDKKSNAFANISTALALAAVMSAAPVVAPLAAQADISGLSLCKDSKAFAKREKQAIKKLENSLKPYAPDSAPALAIKASIEKTKKRFDNYGKQGLLCGTDGLPHLVVNGDQGHWGEFILPGVGFLYIAGWIGWVGRSYLIAVRGEKKPTQKEIIIDVPLASRILGRGLIWPLAALNEVRSGTLVEDDANITVSPR